MYSWFVKLSERIQMRSTTEEISPQELHKTFPYFIWLLRDVTQSLPAKCASLKDYFLRKVRIKNMSRNVLGPIPRLVPLEHIVSTKALAEQSHNCLMV